VRGRLRFAIPTGEKPVVATHGPGGRLRSYEGQFEAIEVPIEDARGASTSLDREGFVLATGRRPLGSLEAAAARVDEDHAEVAAWLADRCGAAEVAVFDRTTRSGDEAERDAGALREPVSIAHNDFTDWSGPDRLRHHLGDAAPRWLAGRFAVIQVWRPVEPILSDPLALCEASSVRPEDLIVTERRHVDRVGEIHQLRHHPDQRWRWFSAMQPSEAIVFKVYDSLDDGRARFTPHASFALPLPGPPRRSVELRCFARF